MHEKMFTNGKFGASSWLKIHAPETISPSEKEKFEPYRGMRIEVLQNGGMESGKRGAPNQKTGEQTGRRSRARLHINDADLL